MNIRVTRQVSILTVLLSAGTIAAAQRGTPQANRPDNPQSLAHIDAAKKIAGDDAFLANPYKFFCVAGNARAQNNNAPDLEPTRLFDNVYAVGNSETAVYAVTSSEGILLLDAGFDIDRDQPLNGVLRRRVPVKIERNERQRCLIKNAGSWGLWSRAELEKRRNHSGATTGPR